MAVRVLLGAAVSALALMLWAFMFWVVLSAPGGVLKGLPDELAMMEQLRDALPESGSYVFPIQPDPKSGEDNLPALEEFRRRNVTGPVGMLHFTREGADPLSVRTYLKGFVHFYVASLVAALLMCMVIRVLDTYTSRVVFVFGLGIFAAIAVRLSDPIWWHLPWQHFAHSALYHASSWLIAGIVLGGMVRPLRAMTHLTDASKPLWKRALDVD